MPLPLVGFVPRALDRWVLLRSAEAAAEALPAGRRGTVVALREAGDRRSDAALGERGVAAWILADAAVPFYLRAAVIARGSEVPSADAGEERLWELYDDIARAGLLAPVPAPLRSARRTAEGSSPEVELEAGGEASTDQALALSAFLADAVELRTPAAIRRQRGLRKGLLALAAAFVVFDAVTHLPKSASLALHASVVASSRRTGSGPPQDLTNGKIEPSLAFATKDEADPWVMIDLGPALRISELTLFGAEDHLADGMPLRAETSADGTTWDPAAELTKPFTAGEPSVLSFTTRVARFVRIHGRHGGAVYLDEVEVR